MRLLRAAIVVVFTAAGIAAMRAPLEPVTGALMTPRGMRPDYHLIAGTPALPAIAGAGTAAGAASDWVVLGKLAHGASEQMTDGVKAYTGAVVRCDLPGDPGCSDESSDGRAAASVCGVDGPTGVEPCRPYPGQRLVLLRFFQKTSRVDLRDLRAGCRQEACRWLEWNQHHGAGAQER